MKNKIDAEMDENKEMESRRAIGTQPIHEPQWVLAHPFPSQKNNQIFIIQTELVSYYKYLMNHWLRKVIFF